MADSTLPDEDPVVAAKTRRLGLLVGLIISVVLGGALVMPTLKAGISPGVSPLVVLFCWVAVGAAMGPRLKRFLAIAQVTGSGGSAVTAGVVFVAPIIQILTRERGMEVPGVDVPLLIVASLSGSLLGFGFVGYATKRFLTDPRLPAPEAVACDRLIKTAVEKPEERPALGSTLIAGLLSGFVVNSLLLLERLQEEVGTITARILSPIPTTDGSHPQLDVNVPLPVAPIYLGIGALLTLPTAILVFSGGLVNSVTTGYAAAAEMPPTTYRWVGGAAMVVCVLYSLVHYVVEGRRKSRAAAEAAGLPKEYDESLLEISPPIKRLLNASIVIGLVLLIAMMFMAGASVMTIAVMSIVGFILVFLLSGLGGLLSLQIGSSASPVSGTVFMGMLVLSLTALAVGLEGMTGIYFLVPIVVAACVAICAANDSSQDYKTMQFNGFRVSESFIGQLVGLLGGAIAVPLAVWIAHDAYTLGTDALPAPQASFFSTVLQSLFLAEETPVGPVMVGAGLGVVAVLVETIGRARGVILSSLAFAVGIYLPSVIGTGIILGALARYFATRRIQATTHEGILSAAGLITGDALASLLFGILIIAGINVDSWKEGAIFPDNWGIEVHPAEFFGAILLAIMLLLIWRNYAVKRAQADD
ncbi:MAG: OPT/YSL family transporter [Planctomycetota bacterium]|jgi:putative OPT family oligopeptide transporter